MRRSSLPSPRGAWRFAGLIVMLLAPVVPGQAETLTPRELLQRMEQSYDQIQSYDCLLTIFSRKDRRTETMKLRFAYKKPGLLRARVVEGPSRGSEVAINGDGRIRARQRGVLRAIKLTLDKDDRRLRNLRGVPVWEAEWGAFLKKIGGALNHSTARSVVQAGENDTLMLDIRLTGANGPERQLYVVEKSTYHLKSGETYEGDVLVSRVVCDKERLNPDLPNGFFNM
jgi:outer membrane lipoprotein-sorting protein